MSKIRNNNEKTTLLSSLVSRRFTKTTRSLHIVPTLNYNCVRATIASDMVPWSLHCQ